MNNHKISTDILLELMENSIPGGVMAGYNEPGFPYYYINHQMIDYLGYSSREEFIDDIDGLISNCFHPDDIETVERETEQQLKENREYHVEYRMRKKDGSYINIQDTGKLQSMDNGRELIVSVCQDITRTKKKYNFLDKILDNITGGLGLYRVDEEMHLKPVFRSSGVINFFQMGSEKKNLSDVMVNVHPEDADKVKQAVVEAMEDGKTSSITYRVCYDLHQYRWINGMFSRFLDNDGEFLLQIFFMPSTKQFKQQMEDLDNKTKELASALQAAEQASLAKSEFLSRMSHEIRTPMNAIIGITSLAMSDINKPHVVKEDLSKIGMSARYLLSLINDILDMSRIESGRLVLNMETIEFESFIASVNNIVYAQCSEKGVAYDAIVDGFVESAYIGDQVKLQQVLVNILGNSVKFTPKGGKITLRIQQLRRESTNAVMRFTINDTGVGIDEEFLPHIFNAFEQEQNGITSPYGGSGLGLAICKSIVEMMDGHIEVHSIKGIGSEFVIELKLGISDSDARDTILKRQAQLPELNTLIVDDDIIVCQTTVKTLQRMGMKCEWADSGLEAVARVKQHYEEATDFDLILLDWKMPGMDGIETAKEIRKIVGPEVTIIIMTAYDWSQIETTARAAGVNMFIQKPLFQSTLISAFSKIYRKDNTVAIPDFDKYHLGGKHILLVEDHPINVEVAKRLLEKEEMIVTVANNGLAAIEIFAQSLPGTFDAILMDVRMPIMDGLTAASHIRMMKKEGSRTIPIIAMTANAFDDDVRKSKASGMDAHLAKPIDPNLLYATLEKMLNPLKHEYDIE